MKLILAKQFAQSVALAAETSQQVKSDVLALVVALAAHNTRENQSALSSYITAHKLLRYWPLGAEMQREQQERAAASPIAPTYAVTAILPAWVILTDESIPNMCCLHIMSHRASYSGVGAAMTSTHHYVMENIIVIGAHAHETLCVELSKSAIALAIKQSAFTSVPLVYINRGNDLKRIKRLEVRSLVTGDHAAAAIRETYTMVIAAAPNGATTEWPLHASHASRVLEN